MNYRTIAAIRKGFEGAGYNLDPYDLFFVHCASLHDGEYRGCVRTSAKCNKPLVVSEEIYWYLCKRKVDLRVHSIDEVLGIELVRWQHENGQKISTSPCYSVNRRIKDVSET